MLYYDVIWSYMGKKKIYWTVSGLLSIKRWITQPEMKVKKIGDSEQNAGVKLRSFPGCWHIDGTKVFRSTWFRTISRIFSDFRTISRISGRFLGLFFGKGWIISAGKLFQKIVKSAIERGGRDESKTGVFLPYRWYQSFWINFFQDDFLMTCSRGMFAKPKNKMTSAIFF